ncbi:MAG: sensor histidine kinase [Chitinophagaceae bacterium]|jgi:two-component system phosphate regulon sensor histidine kinase PhoR
MFESKNNSPARIAFYISASAALTALFIALLAGNDIAKWAVISSVVFLVSFLVARYLINEFIYRRVKLIYKFINQTKASKREEFFQKNILPQQSLDEVGEEVLKWADHRKAEMEVLERNEAFRKEFLQNLSHEFKTPAFAIQGYLETLIDGAAENHEVNKKFLSNAYKNTERLIHLISDLDEITRLESGKQEMHYQHFVIQDLINEVFETLSIKTSVKKINCLIKKGCEQPILVHADKEKIRQVLINLVDNAAKYGSEEGKIEASIYKTDDKTALIEITDDGIGIAEEHLPRIFERFYRTDYGRSRNIGGTGLGLAICKHIIEAHGHFIQARSTPGIGTTFGFTLHLAKK